MSTGLRVDEASGLVLNAATEFARLVGEVVPPVDPPLKVDA
jgi:hypothetical protein